MAGPLDLPPEIMIPSKLPCNSDGANEGLPGWVGAGRRCGWLRAVFRQRKTRFNGAARRAFQTTDAAGHVHLLVHFHAHRAAAAAKIAFHAFLGIVSQVKQAEPVEQSEQPAERTENPAPRPMNE